MGQEFILAVSLLQFFGEEVHFESEDAVLILRLVSWWVEVGLDCEVELGVGWSEVGGSQCSGFVLPDI